MKIFNTDSLNIADLKNTVQDYLTSLYSNSKNIYKSSSPFGQILNVINEYFKLLMLYLEDAVTENNILTANKQNSIHGLSRISGHNPTRALSAQGNIKIKISKSILGEISASYITIADGSRIKCLDNNQTYFIQLGNALENIKISLADDNYISLKVIQGELETQRVIATGGPIQSYNITSKSSIEHEMVSVLVNGELYENVNSLYDMIKDENQCIVLTGIGGGIDIYFGNENFGTMPKEGSTITVQYVKTSGVSGNIISNSSNINWKWLDAGYTNIGEEVDLNKAIITEMDKPLLLGANSESLELTKLIAPHMSRSFVLANPDNYIKLLSRFNYSYVDAYTLWNDEYINDDNVVYLFLLPDINSRLDVNVDYFTTNISNFKLSDFEKEAIIKYINNTGSQIMGTEVAIVDPIIKKYILNIFIRTFDTYDAVQIYNDITTKMTEYFLQIKRRDRIPKSDLIAIIEAIPGIDSVNVTFLSEENETAITNGSYSKTTIYVDGLTGAQTSKTNTTILSPGEDPNLGLDDFGDIIIGLNEVPVIRGDWNDRYGNYIEDGIYTDKMSSINISVKDVIKETSAIRKMNIKKNNL